ncbi:trypsin beta-like [Leguminivora glycinivorella]|uniref:trypsin beta-like n=1 Tax=Leguminivora glycinivorella TaxID=1035111 RepID=UPI00200EA3DE|nr:trypsin beta-like [Leguminivora glycinivorella]
MVILPFIIIPLFFSLCSSEVKKLIVGGKNVVDIIHFPHALYILFTCPGETGTWLCGGSILTQNVFLTAAHCLNMQCNMKIEAVAGSENVQKSHSIIRLVDKYHRHEYYDDQGLSLRNDIALLACKVPLPLGRNVKRVVVAKHFPRNTKMVAVAGWGRFSETSTALSKTLKFVWQFLQTESYCQRRLGEPLWAGQMCATNNAKNYPTVHDSGCALVSKSGHQLGLVSYRIPTVPDVVVYTNVSHFYPWIKKNARNIFCQLSKLPRKVNEDDYYGEDPNVEPDKDTLMLKLSKPHK